MAVKHGFFWAGLAVVGGVTLYSMYRRKNKPPLFLMDALPKNHNAVTIPPFGIFVKKSEASNTALLAHELVHWQQFQKKGLIPFYVCYASELSQHGYDGMPMEQEARGNESEYCKYFYTDCVREGKARTVYNPDFRN